MKLFHQRLGLIINVLIGKMNVFNNGLGTKQILSVWFFKLLNGQKIDEHENNSIYSNTNDWLERK